MKSEPKRGDKVMKLKSVRLVNYRCFTDTEIEFDKHITLLVGKNGTGKTAILDAVAVSVSTFLLGIDGSVSRSILRDDTRYEFHDLHGTIDPQYQFQVSIESIGDCLDQQNVKWIRSLNSESRKTTIKDASDLTGIAKKAQNQIMTGVPSFKTSFSNTPPLLIIDLTEPMLSLSQTNKTLSIPSFLHSSKAKLIILVA